MAPIIFISVASLAGAIIFLKISTWRKNYKTAKTAGFPTFYSPAHITDMWWLVLYPVLAPFAKSLPHSWQTPWLPLSQVWNIWKVGHQPFEDAGSATISLATPNGNMLWTCDPVLIKQLYTLNTVQVPVKMLKFWDVWGPTLGSVEGEEWKNHRKIVTYGLNPSTFPTVWKESIHQTDTLVDRWAEDDYIVEVPKHWTSRLALHVISSVFFDRKLEWKECLQDSKSLEKGYRISFESALFTVLKRLGLIFMMPRALLRILPFKAVQEANTALIDFTKYMHELRSNAANKLEEVASKRNKTVLESIVVAGSPGISQSDSRPLSEESILGNIFFTLLAGHETTGNTLAFTLHLLAIYPEHQVEIQKQLDSQLGERTKQDWSVEHDYQALRKGYLGAVLKEVLRLYNVVQFIFRLTVAPTTVRDSKGNAHVIPANTTCMINVAATYQNPSIWTPREATPERRAELHHSQAIDFDPLRWIEAQEDADTPSYLPFGYGSRQCPGKPFAQIEMVAVLATLLKHYSLELVVDEQTLKESNGDEKVALVKTQDQAIRQLKDDVEANVTIQIVKKLPIRVVKRSR